MKIALVHDDFCQEGGAERLFGAIAQIFPDAPVYTALVNWKKLPEGIVRSRVKASFMQKIPFSTRFYKLLLPLYPLAFESLDLSAYDLVISSTTRFAKSIVTSPKTTHVCYINSVPRFLWNKDVLATYLPSLFMVLLGPLLNWMRRWDRISAKRVDFYIANSKNVQESVVKIYGTKPSIVHPFVDTEFFHPPKISNWKLKSENYYLIVSRLEKWKKIDIAISAFRKGDRGLYIVGSGKDEARLKSLGGTNSKFLGNVSREELRDLYQNALGLIMTQEEDFGIAGVEAQACGIPVVAYGRGGQTETIVDGASGLFFESQSTASLEDAIVRASGVKWNPNACRKNALKFGKEQFLSKFKQEVLHYAGKQQ